MTEGASLDHPQIMKELVPLDGLGFFFPHVKGNNNLVLYDVKVCSQAQVN